jgi:hypothetical protein
VEKQRFSLFNGGSHLRLELIGDARWKVVGASKKTGFKVGDEVTPQGRHTWQEAKRRVNSARSALSPLMLVLLRGEGFDRSEKEIKEILRTRPWEPDRPPAA